MRLVVDTNRIIAGLLRDSASRRLLTSDRFTFLTAGLARTEAERHLPRLAERIGISYADLYAFLDVLFSWIVVVPDSLIETVLKEAREVMGAIDPADAPFLALALAVPNDGIWTEDRHFFRQTVVKTWKTTDLLPFLEDK